jgi:hypothetical protein
MSRRDDLMRQKQSIRKFEREQRDAAVAKKLLKSDGVDDPLFTGSRDATFVQRVGAVILGAFFVIAGVSFATLGFEKQDWILGCFSVPWFLLGARMLQNAFKRKRLSATSGRF